MFFVFARTLSGEHWLFLHCHLMVVFSFWFCMSVFFPCDWAVLKKCEVPANRWKVRQRKSGAHSFIVFHSPHWKEGRRKNFIVTIHSGYWSVLVFISFAATLRSRAEMADGNTYSLMLLLLVVLHLIAIGFAVAVERRGIIVTSYTLYISHYKFVYWFPIFYYSQGLGFCVAFFIHCILQILCER